MLELGRHAEFVWLSYGFAGILVGALVVWLLLDGRRLARRLAELEAQGARRRSGAAFAGGEGRPADGAARKSSP